MRVLLVGKGSDLIPSGVLFLRWCLWTEGRVGERGGGRSVGSSARSVSATNVHVPRASTDTVRARWPKGIDGDQRWQQEAIEPQCHL